MKRGKLITGFGWLALAIVPAIAKDHNPAAECERFGNAAQSTSEMHPGEYDCKIMTKECFYQAQTMCLKMERIWENDIVRRPSTQTTTAAKRIYSDCEAKIAKQKAAPGSIEEWYWQSLHNCLGDAGYWQPADLHR